MAEANKYEYTKLNTLAVVSLGAALTMFGAPAALLTGFIALAQIKQKEQKGRWMAISGIVLASIAIVVGIIGMALGTWLRIRGGLQDHDGFRTNGDHDNWQMPPMNNN